VRALYQRSLRHVFIKPFFLLVKELERKLKSGANGFITDVMPTFDYMKSYMEEQLRAFDS
jgi:hypothetical protein